MELEQIFRSVGPALEQVEAQIAARAAGRFSVLLRGKRLRPAMLLMSAGAVGPRPEPDAVLAAAVVELVHTASLIHDDVIDSAARRRSGAALHRLIGVKPAVIFADLLFVQALSALEELRAVGLVHPLIREVRTMCEGQWLEVKVGAGTRCAERQYFDIIERKTASLFAFCCRAGGLLRRGRDRELVLLEQFGRQFGLAYQLLDDACDLPARPGNSIERAIVEWGGPAYLRRKARVASRKARQALQRVALQRVPSSVARSLGHLLNYLLEV